MGQAEIKKAEKALVLKDPEKVKEALRSLGSDASDDALAVYLKAFTYSSWMVRETASVLMGSAGEAVLKFLDSRFDKLTADQAYWAIKVVERLGAKAIPLLGRFLAAPDKDVRREAIQSFRSIDVPEVLPPLILRLEDPVWTNRQAAAAILEGKAGKLPVIESMQKALEKSSENVTFWVLRIMSRLIGSDPGNPVHAFLKSPNIKIRCSALSAMGHMVDDASIPVLISHLNDPSWIVRKEAASALMERGEHVEEFLKAAFKEGSHDMKYWAIKILARLTGYKRISTYRGFVQGQVEELKYYGMQALSEIPGSESVLLLIDCFRDRSWGVRKFASEQLVHQGPPAVPHLMNKVATHEDDVKYWCIRTLADMGPLASAALMSLIASADKDTRAYVLGALQPPLADECQAALANTLDDPEVALQKRASDVLAAQGLPASRVLVGELYGDNVNKRYWAKKLLVGLGNPCLDELLDALDSEDKLRPKAAAFFKGTSGLDLMSYLNGSFKDLKDRITQFEGPAGGEDVFNMSGVWDPNISKGLFKPGAGAFAGTGTFKLPTGIESPLNLTAAASAGTSPDGVRPMTGTELDHFLRLVKEKEGSDLHLQPGFKPVIRIHGHLAVLEEYNVTTKVDAERMLTGILTEDQKRKLERDLALDCSYEIDGVARFRVNLFNQRKGLNGVCRIIPTVIPSFEDLKIPDSFHKLCMLKQGIVLVTGPTGSGKSSTLASMIDYINQTRPEHILTIEDPIEFVHQNKQCIISQREVGQHCRSFADALRSALREDPNIILVGEMRDLETISLAITAAETGHLVFATLHTTNAAQTIDRIIDVYPPHQQAQVRVQLSQAIQAIVAQRLIPLALGGGRLPVHEVLIRTVAISNIIREGKTEQIFSQLQTGKELGMQTLDDALAKLVRRGQIRFEDAVEFCYDRKTFEQEFGRSPGGGIGAGSSLGGGGGGGGGAAKFVSASSTVKKVG